MIGCDSWEDKKVSRFQAKLKLVKYLTFIFSFGRMCTKYEPFFKVGDFFLFCHRWIEIISIKMCKDILTFMALNIIPSPAE